VWSDNLPKIMAEAQKEPTRTGKPQRIFVDLTAKSCANCRLNENDVFSRDDVIELIQQYKLVQLYTDEVPAYFYSVDVDLDRVKADGRTNYHFQKDRAFGNVELPLYAVLSVQGDNKLRIEASYTRGRITDVDEFARFLKDNAGQQ